MPQIPLTAFPHFSSALRRAIFRGNCRFQEPFPEKCTFAHRFRSMVDFGVWCPGRKFEDRIWPWILNILLFLQRLHLNILPVVTQTAPLCQSCPCLLRFSIPPKYKSGRSHPWLRPVWLQRMLSSAFTSQPGRLQRRGAGSVCRDPEPHRAAHW